jgi:hypothetical protein
MEDVQRFSFRALLQETKELPEIGSVCFDVALPSSQCRPPALSLLGFVGALCSERLTSRTCRPSLFDG